MKVQGDAFKADAFLACRLFHLLVKRGFERQVLANGSGVLLFFVLTDGQVTLALQSWGHCLRTWWAQLLQPIVKLRKITRMCTPRLAPKS